MRQRLLGKYEKRLFGFVEGMERERLMKSWKSLPIDSRDKVRKEN